MDSVRTVAHRDGVRRPAVRGPLLLESLDDISADEAPGVQHVPERGLDLLADLAGHHREVGERDGRAGGRLLRVVLRSPLGPSS
jgi:hypothetical protein